MSFDFSRVKKQPVNFIQINKYLQKAYKTIQTSQKNLSNDEESSFTLAYEAMLKISLALMLSRGYRARTQLGHHGTLVYFAKYVLGNKFSPLMSTYNRMRSKRNKLIYDTNSVTKTEADQAIRTAKRYYKIVEQKISKDNPQQKLWRP